MNFVEVAGHLGADAEERFTATGKKVVSLRMATKVRQGGKDETIWWRINIWGDRFDKMVPYFRKGSSLIVIGEMMKPEIYQDKEGKSQVSLTISAEIIRFNPFGKGTKEGEEEENKKQRQPFNAPDKEKEEALFGAKSGNDDSGFTGDDLPF